MQVLANEAPATEKQLATLDGLFSRKFDAEKAAECREWLATHRISKATASDRIGKLGKMPDVASAEDLEIGMYRVDGEIFKVQRAVHGSGHLYAKRLTEDGFEYATGAIRKIKASDRMTLDEAKEYGRLTGTCCQCGRTLTDENSIAEGIGPVCSGKI